MKEIDEKMVKSQAWKFYFVLAAWPAFLFLIPLAVGKWGWLSAPLFLFPGLFLFTWTGYLMHECWHKYVPSIPSKLFYNLYASMLLTDPQVYNLIHGSHHAQVNSWDDVEFHPAGKIKSRALRSFHNIVEIALGILFLTVMAMAVVPGHPAYKDKFSRVRQLIAILTWIVFFGGIGTLSALVFRLNPLTVVISYAAMLWTGSFFLHQSQLVEHGNLIVPGEWNVRNVKTRNLSGKGFFEKIFLFFTHDDSREHVLHHTMVRKYLRPFPGSEALPSGTTVIGFRNYFKILGDMVSGRDSAL